MTHKDRNKLQKMKMWLTRKMIKTNWVERKSNEIILEEIGERRSLMSKRTGKSNLLSILFAQ